MTPANPDALIKTLRDGGQCSDPCKVKNAESGCTCAEAADCIERVTAERDAAIQTCEMAATSGGFYARHAETAEARAAQQQAEVEAKDRAILLLLPFVDYAAGEGLMFVETEDGEHPEMDAAGIMAAVAEALGLELGSDAYLSLLPKGYFAIRTALAARAATAREMGCLGPASAVGLSYDRRTRLSAQALFIGGR